MKKLVMSVFLVTILVGCGSSNNLEDIELKEEVHTKGNLPELLSKSVDEVNEIAPQNLDAVTLITHASADGDTFIYHYELNNMNKSSVTQSEIDALYNFLIVQGCGVDAYSVMFDAGANIMFNYKDKSKNNLFDVILTKDICEEPEKYTRPISE